MLRGPGNEQVWARGKPRQLLFVSNAGRGLLGADCVFLVPSPVVGLERPLKCRCCKQQWQAHGLLGYSSLNQAGCLQGRGRLQLLAEHSLPLTFVMEVGTPARHPSLESLSKEQQI